MTPSDPFGPIPMMPPHVPEPPRSGIPKVIGILMIIFGLLGVIGGFNSLFGPGLGIVGLGHGGIAAMMRISRLVGLAMPVFEVIAGVKLVNYRTSGPGFANIYAVANIVTTVVFGVLEIALIGGEFVGPGVVLGMLVSVAWPIVVLALVNQPRARASCARTF